jgi:hypothetical protein
MKTINLKNCLELAARIHVFIFLKIYGLGKIVGGQFYRRGKLPEDVASQLLVEASAYDLAWTFMGYSQAYIVFIGVSQIIGAFLLLFNRTKFIGILILVPILVNIIVFDIIFLPDYGALSSAILYFSLLLLVLYLNKTKLLQLFNTLLAPLKGEAKLNSFKMGLAIIGILGVFFAIQQGLIYVLDKY